jgi:3'-phosphoadenosine 5'-phosphosulfate sulfotransferase (PAPS reductase)/FAD synthetase
MSRVVVWFSAGAASAVAWKLAVAEYGDSVIAAYTDPGSEHPDNQRFIADCEKWVGSEVIRLKSKKYADTWQVFTERRFLNSPYGALCTTELKKMVRRDFQEPDDIQVFGYTAEEEHRADRFREQNPEVNLATPLIERGLTKDDCLAMVDRAGIELPAMYKLGYRNNNCIGCVKGGMGYWNKIRNDFPEVFERMAKVEREIGATVLRDEGEQLFLDELEPGRGHYPAEPDIQCGLLCMAAEGDMDGEA